MDVLSHLCCDRFALLIVDTICDMCLISYHHFTIQKSCHHHFLCVSLLHLTHTYTPLAVAWFTQQSGRKLCAKCNFMFITQSSF